MTVDRVARRAPYVLLAAALLCSACSWTERPVNGSPVPAGTGASSSAASSSVAPSPRPSTPTPSGVGCGTSELRVTLGTIEGAAGGFYESIEFQNSGRRTCELSGYPGVSFVDVTGRPLGSPVERTGESATRLSLTPGRYAAANLRLPDTDNIPADTCHVADTARLKVYPPNQVTAVELPLNTRICTSGEVGTQVGPVQLAAPFEPDGSSPNRPAGLPQGGANSGTATGGGCFGCVTITALQLAVAGADVNDQCLPASTTVPGPWAVIGPSTPDPYRVFQLAIRFVTAALGTEPRDGRTCSAGYSVSVSLEPATSRFELQATAPVVPFVVQAGTEVHIDVSLHAPEGNFYNGPLTIYVTFGPP